LSGTGSREIVSGCEDTGRSKESYANMTRHCSPGVAIGMNHRMLRLRGSLLRNLLSSSSLWQKKTPGTRDQE
jgi:hypothetical protein